MGATNWFLAFHLIGLFVYMGGLLNLSRLLGYHVKEEAVVRERLSWMEKRMYFFVTLPGLVIALTFGMLLFLGVGDGVPGISAAKYMKVRMETPAGEIPSLWYLTFHVKLVLIILLLCLDFYMGSQIVKLSKGGEVPKAWKFKALHGLIALVLITIVILMKAGPLKGANFDQTPSPIEGSEATDTEAGQDADDAAEDASAVSEE